MAETVTNQVQMRNEINNINQQCDAFVCKIFLDTIYLNIRGMLKKLPVCISFWLRAGMENEQKTQSRSAMDHIT
jgi:hypothetical protein